MTLSRNRRFNLNNADNISENGVLFADDYNYRDPELVELLREQFLELFPVTE